MAQQLPLLFDDLDLPAIEISLTQGYTALVDPIDMDLLDYKWRVSALNGNTRYAFRAYRVGDRRANKKVNIHLHRVILERALKRNLSKLEEVDHINGNGLDNRRVNLRLATRFNQVWNTRRRKDNSVGFKGVYKHGNKYRAVIQCNNCRKRLGTFDTPESAHKAYCKAAHELHGEFARTE